MNTIFLGNDEVDAYCKDLVGRLRELPSGFPDVICPIGESGRKLLIVMAKQMRDLVESIRIAPILYDKKSCLASLEDPSDASTLAEAKLTLVLDSSVHSGQSMLAAIRLVQDNGAKHPIAYSLVIKQSTRFMPHYFGLVVGDHDRTLFMLDSIPNNRLFAGNGYQPVGIFRRIESSDANRQQCLDIGVASLDKISWGDLYYEHRVNGYDVIVVEDGNQLAGYIKIKIKHGNTLFIDVIANDKSYRGKGVGGALMRYVENMGRSLKLGCIELWSIENQIPFYQDKCEFHVVKDERVIDAGGGERYTLMRRPLLYHFNLSD